MLNLSQTQRALLEQRLKGRALRAVEASEIPRRAQSHWAPVSFVQEELWRTAQTGDLPPTYLGTVLRYSGCLDLAALQRSVAEVSRRHASLRTSFEATDRTDLCFQLIDTSAVAKVMLVDLLDVPSTQRITVAQHRAAQGLARPFDRTQAPLWRVTVFRLEPDEHVLTIALDDLIADFLSLGILVQELAELYEAFSRNKPSPLPEPQIQYGDWAAWQRDIVARGELKAQFSYWTKHLKDCPPPLELPFSRPRLTVRTFNGTVQIRELPSTVSNSLRNLSREQKVGLYTVLLCAFALLLRHYSQRDEFVLGRGVTGRTRRETERLIGCFINMVLLRVDLQGNPTFVELLKRVQTVVDGAYANQDVPFSELVKALREDIGPREPLPAPIFFNLYTAPAVQKIEAARISVFDLGDQRPQNIALFQDLLLGIQDSGNRLVAELKYNRDLFADTAMEQLLADYQACLEKVVAAPQKQIQDLHPN